MFNSDDIERLALERQLNQEPPPRRPSELALSKISIEPSVFQIRADGLDEERVEEISADIMDKQLAERVLVWWSGCRWVLVDGHHRIAAYSRHAGKLGKDVKVPVETLADTSLSEAIGAAARLNAREKVTITREERNGTAWVLVCRGQGSIAEQAGWSGVSQSQISIMRSALERLTAERIPPKRLISMGWDWSRERAKGNTSGEFTPEMLEAMAQQWAQKIGKATAGKAQGSPDVLARALEIMSKTLPSALLETEPFWDALNTTGRALLDEAAQEGEELEGGCEEEDTEEDCDF